MSHPQGATDSELEALVEGNPGQGTLDEYVYLRDIISRRRPCRLLVFGVGKDSRIWMAANEGGRTVFVEHETEWIAKTREQIPGVNVVQVRYGTKRTQWKKLMGRHHRLFMEDLPNDVIAENWDVIFVDSPQGGSDKRPGRMKSIYTASVLARRSTDVDVLLHDCDREIEAAYGDAYFGDHLLVKTVRTLRHYHMRPSLSADRD